MRAETKVALVSIAGLMATGTAGVFVHDGTTALICAAIVVASLATIALTVVLAWPRS